MLASLFSPEALSLPAEDGDDGGGGGHGRAVPGDDRQPGERGGAHPGRGGPEPDCLVIYASLGLGRTVVEGRRSGGPLCGGAGRPPPPAVRGRSPGRRPCCGPRPAAARRRRRCPRRSRTGPPSPRTAIQTLAHWALALERYFKRPQEIEWALDDAGRCWLLQSRGLVSPRPRRPRGRIFARPAPVIPSSSGIRGGGPCRGGLRAGLPGAVRCRT